LNDSHSRPNNQIQGHNENSSSLYFGRRNKKEDKTPFTAEVRVLNRKRLAIFVSHVLFMLHPFEAFCLTHDLGRRLYRSLSLAAWHQKMGTCCRAYELVFRQQLTTQPQDLSR